MKTIRNKTSLFNVKTIFVSLLFVIFFSLFVSCTTDESDELMYHSIAEEQEILANDEENQPTKDASTVPPKYN
jgi:hypothetical protein